MNLYVDKISWKKWNHRMKSFGIDLSFKQNEFLINLLRIFIVI